MKIKLQDNTEQHVDSSVGRALVAAGLATEIVKTPDSRPVSVVEWSVRQGVRVEDTRLAPEILMTCSVCGKTTLCFGTKVHRTQFYHCRISEPIPEHILKQYAGIRAAWEKRQQPKPPITSATDTARDRYVMRQGIRTGEVVVDPVAPGKLAAFLLEESK